MATSETIATKKVTDLTENTSVSDSDLFVVGNLGTSVLRKLKWSNIITAIKNKLGGAATYSVANNLTTTASSYVLDARQGKALSDKIGTLSSLGTSANGNVVDAVNEVNSAVDELNTKIDQDNSYLVTSVSIVSIWMGWNTTSQKPILGIKTKGSSGYTTYNITCSTYTSSTSSS